MVVDPRWTVATHFAAAEERMPTYGQVYAALGPGLRLSICNRVDTGVGVLFGLGDQSWSDVMLRMEMRVLF